MPAMDTNECICWTQRVQKEDAVRARSRPASFSVRAAVSVADVPAKFKPGHINVMEALKPGEQFDPASVGWDPSSTVAREFRRCMKKDSAGPRERHQFPATTSQELGWCLARAGNASERAGAVPPTRLGLGWESTPPFAEAAGNAEQKNKRQATDPVALPQLPLRSHASAPELGAKTRSQQHVRRKRRRDPLLELETQEKNLAAAFERSKMFLNGNRKNRWYKPLSNSDVALFADEYTKSWGVGLYSKKSSD
eukprot:gnl/TRDRNA2_/TRDRNA2_185544_c0_seq1.p1 gnl/TRDRNA2_/TRDRNA2_185544_c0~~gnl/TRDRNA2_/TRDRNA2_185544_c0_seq1.p1  ORF type:complete len:252 (+),score=47.42 gnl/TRDRNA2_/TRDRNA2_185544_c0_seq1:88-843(+)